MKIEKQNNTTLTYCSKNKLEQWKCPLITTIATIVLISSIFFYLTATGTLPFYAACIAGTVDLIALSILPILFCKRTTAKTKKNDLTNEEKNLPEKKDSPILISFYAGNGLDCEGRSFESILKWDDEKLESEHDYIQWFFPSFRPSNFNSKAPLLTENLLKDLKNNEKAQNRLECAFHRMLLFFGLKYEEGEIERLSSWKNRKNNWVTSENHNYLRITRMLDFLVFMGKNDLAKAFYLELEKIKAENTTEISNKTLNFWKTAANR